MYILHRKYALICPPTESRTGISHFLSPSPQLFSTTNASVFTHSCSLILPTSICHTSYCLAPNFPLKPGHVFFFPSLLVTCLLSFISLRKPFPFTYSTSTSPTTASSVASLHLHTPLSHSCLGV